METATLFSMENDARSLDQKTQAELRRRAQV
jgi:hypothetical protein